MVVQNDIFNKSKINTVVVCVLTSNIARSKIPGNVLLNKGECNLSKDSVVNVSQIITVNKADLIERIGSMSDVKIIQVIDGLKMLIEPRDVE